MRIKNSIINLLTSLFLTAFLSCIEAEVLVDENAQQFTLNGKVYDRVQVISRRAASTVLKVQSREHGLLYALKIATAVGAQKCDSYGVCVWPSLAEEYEVLRKLDGPLVVRVFAQEKNMLLLELADGDLDGLIKEGAFVNNRDAAKRILSMFFEAQKYVHSKGILQLDPHTSNVLYFSTSPNIYIIKLTDFDLVNHVDKLPQDMKISSIAKNLMVVIDAGKLFLQQVGITELNERLSALAKRAEVARSQQEIDQIWVELMVLSRE